MDVEIVIEYINIYKVQKYSWNVPLFKSLLRKLLLQYVFYSVDEYYQQNFNDCVY